MTMKMCSPIFFFFLSYFLLSLWGNSFPEFSPSSGAVGSQACTPPDLAPVIGYLTNWRLQCFLMLVEKIGVPRENLLKNSDNVQTPHRKAQECHEVTVITTRMQKKTKININDTSAR